MPFVRGLVWDEWNVEHVARHGVAVEEVEQVCLSSPFVTKASSRTFRAIGQSWAGHYLTVILSSRGRGTYYTVTAREATQQERRLYLKNRGR